MLNEAIKIGNAKLVQKLLDVGAPIDEYAIFAASRNGHIEIVHTLLNAKAPIDKNAISIARLNNHTEIVKLLESKLKTNICI